MFTMRACIILLYVVSVVAKPLEKHESLTTPVTGRNHSDTLLQYAKPAVLTARHRTRRQTADDKFLKSHCKSIIITNRSKSAKNQCIDVIYTCAPHSMTEMDCSLSSFGKHYCQPIYRAINITIRGVRKCVLQTFNCKSTTSPIIEENANC